MGERTASDQDATRGTRDRKAISPSDPSTCQLAGPARDYTETLGRLNGDTMETGGRGMSILAKQCRVSGYVSSLELGDLAASYLLTVY